MNDSSEHDKNVMNDSDSATSEQSGVSQGNVEKHWDGILAYLKEAEEREKALAKIEEEELKRRGMI